MACNYLKDIAGDAINMLLATVFNFRKWMREYAQFFYFLQKILSIYHYEKFDKNFKVTF